MLTHYLILDLPPDADDETIRQRYLALVRTHTPESDPVTFRRITAAYEAVKDERRRIASRLFGCIGTPDYEAELMRLARARKPRRRRAGLREMITAAEKHR